MTAYVLLPVCRGLRAEAELLDEAARSTFSSIVKKFGDFTAVNGITFDVKPARYSGCSVRTAPASRRSSACSMTLLPPTAGTALVNGFDVVKQSDDVRQSIGVIPQAMTSDLELSVEENLIIYAKLYGVPREKRTRLIPELLERSS